MPRVLVVDDEMSIREALARWLTLRGFDVEKAEDGQAAVERCAAAAFDIITMDLEMPRLGGLDAIEVIRKTQPAVPILVLTGYPNRLETISVSGPFKVLTKPQRLQDLEQEIRALLT